MVFAAIAEVGVAMTVMGMVTGDKNLTKTGAMVSMVGGLGSVAAGSSMLSSAAGETAAGEVAATGASEAAASTAAEEASKAAIADTATESAGNIFAGAPTDAAAAGLPGSAPVGGLEAAAGQAAPAGTMPVGTAPEIMPVGASETAASGVSAPTGVMDVGAGFDPLKSVAMDDGTTAGINQVISAGGKTNSNEFLSGFGKFWDGLGPQGKGAAIQMVGGAFSGAAETERHNDMMDYRNRELALRSHGSAVARYNKGGIINSAKA
jgi:hypothetical protein